MASVTAPTSAGTAARSRRRNYARIIEQTWIWSIVGYSLLRFFIAWGAFAEHGANVWVFGLIDVGTAWPYAKSVATVCKRSANSEWKALPLPLAVAVATFFAPYAYLWFAAGEMPAGVRAGMVLCVSVLLVAATAGIVTKIRRLRASAASPVATSNEDAAGFLALAADGDNDVTMIDLRDGAERPAPIIDLTRPDPTSEGRRITR